MMKEVGHYRWRKWDNLVLLGLLEPVHSNVFGKCRPYEGKAVIASLW